MKPFFFTLLTLLIFVTIASAQPIEEKIWKKGKSRYHNIFDASEAYFKETESPEAFKDAPAVILAQKYYFTFESKVAMYYINGGTYKSSQIIRRRIKIQEKAALQSFVELYFSDIQFFGVKLIKPNGQEQLVDVNNAVEVKTEVPKFYHGIYQGRTYYKLAIPNLEVGDILDYYTLRDNAANGTSMTSFVTTLADIYPIVKQQYMIDIPPNWSFFINSLNGAPDVEAKVSRGANVRGKTSRNIRRFLLNDSNRAALITERWAFRYITEPTIKIQVFSVVTEMGPTGLPKPQTKKDGSFIDFMTNPLSFTSKEPNALAIASSDFWDSRYVKSNFNEWRKMESAKAADAIYYYLRYRILPEKDKPQEVLLETHLLDNVNRMTDAAFIYTFQSFLDKMKIDYDFIYAIPTHYGSIDQALTEEEVIIGLYVLHNKRYYFAPNNYSKPNEIPTILNGAEAYKQAPVKSIYGSKKLFATPNKVTLPTISATKNLHQTDLIVDLEEGLKTVGVSATFTLHEAFRAQYAELFLFNEDYKATDEQKLNIEKKGGVAKNKDKAETGEQLANAEKETIKLNAIQEYFEEDYGVTSVQSCDVLNTGRYGKDPLKVKLQFKSEDLLKKAGKNYIFSIGSLIGEQVSLSKEEMTDRKNDIQFETAKTFKNHIQVAIPANFTIEGIDNLNLHIDNPYVSFSSTAILSDGQLEVTTEKVYKQSTAPKEEWPQIVESLEAAYKFMQAKVVLKKSAADKGQNTKE